MGVNISFSICVCDELAEIQQLLNQLIKFIRKEDEIIVQIDIDKGSYEVKDYLEHLNTELAIKGINFHRIFFSLNKDFASFKNNLKDHCTKEWIIQIDADELLHENLISRLPDILEANSEVDVILVPRENYVNGITQQDIENYGWKIDKKGRINYADMQFRIWKNKSIIKWKNRVHEQLIGYASISHLPFDVEGYCLIHVKDIERQRKQNDFYNQI